LYWLTNLGEQTRVLLDFFGLGRKYSLYGRADFWSVFPVFFFPYSVLGIRSSTLSHSSPQPSMSSPPPFDSDQSLSSSLYEPSSCRSAWDLLPYSCHARCWFGNSEDDEDFSDSPYLYHYTATTISSLDVASPLENSAPFPGSLRPLVPNSVSVSTAGSSPDLFFFLPVCRPNLGSQITVSPLHGDRTSVLWKRPR